MKKIFLKIFLIPLFFSLFLNTNTPVAFAHHCTQGDHNGAYFFFFVGLGGAEQIRCSVTDSACRADRKAYKDAHPTNFTVDPANGACGVHPIPTLTANPPSIASGQTSTLQWSATNAATCTGQDFDTLGQTSGSAPVTPPVTTTYTLACTGTFGYAPASVTVTVTAPPPPGATCNPNDGCMPTGCPAPGDPDCSTGTPSPPPDCSATNTPDNQCNTPVPPCPPDPDCSSCSGGNVCIQNCAPPGDPDCAAPSGPIEKLPNPTPGIIDWYSFVRALLSIIIKVMLPIAALLIVYSGFLFLTAQGDEAQLKKAKGAFVWAIIGTAVLLGAWALATAIQGTISTISSGGGPIPPP